MGLFEKLKNGLAKTKQNVSEKLDGVLKMFGKIDEDLFEELEEALIEADLGVETTMEIMDELRDRTKQGKIKEPEQIRQALQEIITDMMSQADAQLHTETKPSIILMIGVNGVGKTTTTAKLANNYKKQGKKVILGAADTFRAAAAEQLTMWADRIGVDIIKQGQGADPAAVVFDTINAAKARGADVIICDTAGRLHNKVNLLNELGKIYLVIQNQLPDADTEVLLVLDATTGQNAVHQAKEFQKVAQISGVVLTKLDGSAKGGIVVPIQHELHLPVKLVGVGEGAEDLQPFVAEDFVKALF
ncbi:MAG: signal recognition particle-docking protein FtsY [Clostridia bacterium]|nr:signal recognition particle-docking protein FtsY [Clostridia bacterium]